MRADRTTFLLTALGAALALSACHPRRLHSGEAVFVDRRPMKSVGRLTCPDTVGRLSRTMQSGDGRSCGYQDGDGATVTLQLAGLDGGSAAARLGLLDADLRHELPAVVMATPAAGGPAGGDQAHINLPGFHLDASDGGARIRMPGVNIDADNEDAKVVTHSAFRQATVSAHGGQAEIRTGGAGPNGVDATYLLASDTPGPTGDRAVGYVAKGPAAGPLVVAEFQTKGRNGHDHGVDGVERLVDLNVHG